MQKLKLLLIYTVLSVTVLSCSEGDSVQKDVPRIAVTGVTLNVPSNSMTTGDTFTLSATVLPENSTNKNVSWSSSNQAVATVQNGVVTAVMAGSATITVTTEDGAKTATCQVDVKKPVAGSNGNYAIGDFNW